MGDYNYTDGFTIKDCDVIQSINTKPQPSVWYEGTVLCQCV